MAKIETRNLDYRLKLLSSPEKLQKIGSAIVKNSIARSILLNSSKAKHNKGVLIKKGEYVPVALAEMLHIEVDNKGLAKKDSQIFTNVLQEDGGYDACTWIDAGGWPESYCECWPDSGEMGLDPGMQVFTRGVTQKELKEVFTEKEISALKESRIIKE